SSFPVNARATVTVCWTRVTAGTTVRWRLRLTRSLMHDGDHDPDQQRRLCPRSDLLDDSQPGRGQAWTTGAPGRVGGAALRAHLLRVYVRVRTGPRAHPEHLSCAPRSTRAAGRLD